MTTMTTMTTLTTIPGKSTTAQLLSRHHGFVYYEGDCFSGCRNPYIPPDVPEPTLAQDTQSRLVGEGIKERKEVVSKAHAEFDAMLKGKEHDVRKIEDFYRAMCQDISRERRRLGGDWVVAMLVPTRLTRDTVRRALGPEVELVVLDMDKEDQVARLHARHNGDPHILQILEVCFLHQY